MVTDLAEIFRLGTAKVKENLAFRRYLSARHYADKPFQILASEVQQHVAAPRVPIAVGTQWYQSTNQRSKTSRGT